LLKVSSSKTAKFNSSPLTKSSTINSPSHSGFELLLTTFVWKIKSGFLGRRQTQYGSDFPKVSMFAKPVAPTILTFSFDSSSASPVEGAFSDTSGATVSPRGDTEADARAEGGSCGAVRGLAERGAAGWGISAPVLESSAGSSREDAAEPPGSAS